MTPRSLGVFLLLPLAILAAADCKGGSSNKTTPTSARSGSPTRPPAASAPAGSPAAGAIRDVDVEGVAAVKKLEADAPGVHADAAQVLYADLTGDGVEEAVVPVTLAGNQRTVGFVVLSGGGAQDVKVLLTEPPGAARGGLALAVQGEKLIATQAAPGPDDPECCPSMLKVTTYAWDGSTLAIESAQTVANPAGGVKGTPPAASTP